MAKTRGLEVSRSGQGATIGGHGGPAFRVWPLIVVAWLCAGAPKVRTTAAQGEALIFAHIHPGNGPASDENRASEALPAEKAAYGRRVVGNDQDSAIG